MGNILRLAVIMMVLTGSFNSCSEDAITNATGTVIGSPPNGWNVLLIQVDKKYQIGKTIELHYGTYYNVIGVQSDLPLINFPENETVINKKILFSFRPYTEEDSDKFVSDRPILTLYAPPDVPLYVITECRIIK